MALNSRTEEKLKKTAAKCQEAGAEEANVRTHNFPLQKTYIDITCVTGFKA